MYYNYGRNYFLSLDFYDIKGLNYDEILDFLRGYIEVYSNIILPMNVSNYFQNINNIYDKYPLLIIYLRKTENIDNILINRIIHLLDNELKIEYIIENKQKIYNKIKYQLSIKLENNNVLNLLSNLYSPNVDKNEIDEYIYSIYLNLSNYKYINYDNENDTLQYYIPKCKIKLNLSYAIKPSKKYASDIGYNIYIIKLNKIISDKIKVYDTGLQIIPQYGYYYKLEPTSLLAIHGYILGTYIANNEQNLLITLIKIDKDLPDIKLPYNCCIMLLKEMIHYELNFE